MPITICPLNVIEDGGVVRVATFILITEHKIKLPQIFMASYMAYVKAMVIV